ncbi:MAG: helix-turn-helix domain-containing protein [Oscillospiraceae bacterium]|nr:helix-turn-helix domain-containing protein [Oscillospiraceae bacterium]
MKLSTNYNRFLKNCPDVMTVEDVSNALGVSKRTVYNLIKNGNLQYISTGRIYLIPKMHLLSYLKLNEERF